MVKLLQLLSVTIAIAAGDDLASLLQVQMGMRHAHDHSVDLSSKGQLILAAVSEASGKDTICVTATVGDVAPITGSFTAKMSHQAVAVAVGSVAEEDGSFCVPTQDVMLLQRSLGLATAQDFDAALGRKHTRKGTGHTSTTTTTVVQECPDKWNLPMNYADPLIGLDADDARVCGCRNFFKDTGGAVWNFLNSADMDGPPAPPALLQKVVAFEAALGGKGSGQKDWQNKNGYTVWRANGGQFHGGDKRGLPVNQVRSAEYGRRRSSGPGSWSAHAWEINPFFHQACAQKSGSWADVAKALNNPDAAEMYKTIFEKDRDCRGCTETAGWLNRCDESWVIEGACAGMAKESWKGKDSQGHIDKIMDVANNMLFKSCAYYSCSTRNWVKRGYHLTFYSANETLCCEPTCAAYACATPNWVKQIGVDNKTKPTDQSCCEPTCATYACTTRKWVKQIGVDNKPKPTEESCCEPSCATVLCPSGQVTKIPWSVPATLPNCCEASLYTGSQQLTPSTSAKLCAPGKFAHEVTTKERVVGCKAFRNKTFGQCAESCFEDDSCFRFAYGKAGGVAECFSHPQEPGKQSYEEVGRTEAEDIAEDIYIYKPQKSCPNGQCPDGFVCQSGVCMETCATYSCPKDYVTNAEKLKYPVDNIVAEGDKYVVDPSLDQRNCCKATCASLPCPRHYGKKNSLSTNVSQSNCCQASCALFTCPQHYETKNSRSTNVSQPNCCQLSCAKFSCPDGYEVKNNALPTVRSQLNCCQLKICKYGDQLRRDKVMPSRYDLLAQPIIATRSGCESACLQDPRCMAFQMPTQCFDFATETHGKCWLKSAWNHDDYNSEDYHTKQLRGCHH